MSLCQGTKEFIQEDAQVKISELVLGLLSNKARVNSCYQVTIAIGNSKFDSSIRMTGVQLATYFGLKDAIISLFRNGETLYLDGRYNRTAVSYAA